MTRMYNDCQTYEVTYMGIWEMNNINAGLLEYIEREWARYSRDVFGMADTLTFWKGGNHGEEIRLRA